MRALPPVLIALPLRALLLAWVFAVLPGLGWAQSQAQSPSQSQPQTQATQGAQDAAPLPDIADLRDQLAKLPTAADTSGDMRGLMGQIAAIGAQADKFIAARTGQLNDLNARLGELGNPPPPGTTEDPDITRQRALLTKERNAVDADVRLARLVVVDAQQRGNDLLNKRRELFEAQISERSASPLGRTFWHDLSDAWPEDIDRLQALGAEVEAGAARARQGAHRGPVLLTLALALLLITAGNLLAERGLVLLAQRLLPGGRLRRSLLVIAIVGANMLIVALALRTSVSTFDAHGLLGAQTRELAKVLSSSLLFMTFVVSLGRALLANARPSWRLPPIPDPMAKRLRAFPLLAALTMVLVWVPAQINALIDASLAAVVATHVITALALTGLIAAMLLRLRGPKAPGAAETGDSGPAALEGADAPPAPHERPLWVAMLLGAITLVLIAIWVLVGMGYVALASLLAGQLMWTGIVACAFYVLFKFADDLFMATVSAKSGFGGRLQKSFGFAPATLDQAAVVLSALARVALFFYMVIALVAPLGTDPGEVFQRSGKFGAGVKIGEFQLVPSAIFSAIGVLVAGFIALRVARHWLQERYLPTTTLEAGMQSSLTTLLGYAGGILVVAIALSALGIGINRIAWIASALSVGIGFGLQAIVQNFISGLILLAERPVKVGDWVVLGTTEGDVRRINVRATEIALGDRSTVIVPNSEFITKTVRNMTLANAEGRVLIRLPMPLNTDAQKVRELMLAACSAHPGVLATPAPSLTLEGIENGQLIFQAIAYVPSPRLAGGVKSDLLFTMLEEFRKAGLALAVPTMVMAAPSPSSSPAAGV
ncbi:DUF3772 domain-containing protein [Xenophilus aerolatus]|nr:DUF3772 domain-containing protein [Xenophilus aerolatus]